MNREQFKMYRRKLILKELKRQKLATANEVIGSIWKKDMKKGYAFCVEKRGWKFYVHLNKFFSPMTKEKLIRCRGMNDKGEKLWECLK